MKGSRKNIPPSVFSDWLALENDNWQPDYGKLSRAEKTAIVEELFKEQRGLCVYCGRKLDLDTPGKSFHIEHFRPASRYPELDIVYENLFLSCGQEDNFGNPAQTCGNAKADWFDETCHIEPIHPDCTHRFEYRLSGDVVPKADNDHAAQQMLSILNLNHPEIRRERYETFLVMEMEELSPDDFFDNVTNLASSYAHAIYTRAGIALP